MLSASRSLRRGASGGKTLPDIDALASLHDAGVHFRLGQVTEIVGRPGAGKSNFAQAIVTRWARAGLPVLYFSLDQDPWTSGVRQAAAVTGHRQEEIAEALLGPGAAYYEEELADLPVDYCFDTRPELPDIGQELDAYVELWDRYPTVIVIDNLLNIEAGEGGHGDQKFVFRNLQGLARDTGAAVFVLHHAREGVRDTTRPPLMSEIDNKQSQIPELILGLAADDGVFRIAALKVRSGGKSDPEAKRVHRVGVDLSTVQITKDPGTAGSAVSDYWDNLE